MSMGDGGMRRLLGGMITTAAMILVAVVSGAGQAQGAATTGDVYVIHGLTGSTADILVDGTNVAPSAAPKTLVGPLRLAPGDHVVTFREGTDTLVSARFTVRAGASLDVVAHRTADSSRQPVVTVFMNDLSAVRPGTVRLVVSHVAVAPPADIRVDGEPLFRNVAGGESLTLDLPAKEVTIDVVPTAVTMPAILPPTKVDLQAGTLTRVFAIGDATEGTVDAVVQVLKVGVVGSGRPTQVRTGDGGQAADTLVGGRPGPATMTLLAALLAFGGVAALNRRRPARPVIGSRHSR
jgi:hypothetical protein